MVSNYKLKVDFFAFFFTPYDGRYPCYANKVHTIAKKDTVQLFLQYFSCKQIDFNIDLLKWGFYEEIFTCIKCILTI